MDKLRVGVLGAGWFACFHHIPRLVRTGEAEVTAVCRRNPQALEQVAEHFNVPNRYTDYARMLDEAPLDAVLVSSPHALHYEHVRAALQRGLPVLTDKPLALTTAEAEELRDLARTKGVTLMVAYGPPYAAIHRYFRDRVANGDIGEIRLAQYTILANPDALSFFGHGEFPPEDMRPVPPTDFRAHSELGGGGYFQDVGNHAVAAILMTTGLRPIEVNATFDNPEWDLHSTATIRFDTGALAIVTTIGDAFPDEKDYRDINTVLYAGTKGSLSTDSRTEQVIYQTWGQPVEFIATDSLPAKSSPAENFIQVLRGREEPMATLEVALDTVRVMEAAYRSARENKPVAIA